jgi:hypothetical protein
MTLKKKEWGREKERSTQVPKWLTFIFIVFFIYLYIYKYIFFVWYSVDVCTVIFFLFFHSHIHLHSLYTIVAALLSVLFTII